LGKGHRRDEGVMDQMGSAGWSGCHVIGSKLPLKLKEIWAIRIRFQLANRARDLTLFDLGLNSKRKTPFQRVRVRITSSEATECLI
jgi:hypothetical protein